MWDAYVASLPAGRPAPGTWVVDSFGDSPALADELLGLVLEGTKRATAALAVEYELAGNPVPAAGDHWVVCDGAGTPRAVLRTTEVRHVPFRDVDAQLARDEGEGDRSLEWWRREHRRYWERVGAESGFELSETSVVVAERFCVVWPPDVADAPAG